MLFILCCPLVILSYTQTVSLEMHWLLRRLRSKCAIGYVSGGPLSKQQKQCSDPSTPVTSLFDFCFPENGATAFRLGQPIPTTSFIEWLGQEKYNRFISWVLIYIGKLDIPVKRGTFVEFRKGNVNISPIGQGATQPEMEDFYQYDKIHGIRQTMIDELRKQFPDLGLTYAMGGKTCFDAFPIGWDKTLCLKHIEAEKEWNGTVYDEIHFFGDKTYEGGNDIEIYMDERTIGHSVTSPEDTMKQIMEIFDL